MIANIEREHWSADEAARRIVVWLKNTIVIFMTDNGTAAGYAPAGPRGQERGFNAGMRA